MLLDETNILSDAQAITATAASTNVYDAGEAGVDMSADAELQLYVTVVQTFNNLTSLQVELQASDDSTFATGVTNQVLSDAIALANLTQGTELLRVKVPYGPGRYRRLYYTVVGTAPTAGEITAGFAVDRQNAIPYKSGLNMTGV